MKITPITTFPLFTPAEQAEIDRDLAAGQAKLTMKQVALMSLAAAGITITDKMAAAAKEGI